MLGIKRVKPVPSVVAKFLALAAPSLWGFESQAQPTNPCESTSTSTYGYWESVASCPSGTPVRAIPAGRYPLTWPTRDGALGEYVEFVDSRIPA